MRIMRQITRSAANHCVSLIANPIPAFLVAGIQVSGVRKKKHILFVRYAPCAMRYALCDWVNLPLTKSNNSNKV
jgi:hypothetical protein